jgi:hypothetical protein
MAVIGGRVDHDLRGCFARRVEDRDAPGTAGYPNLPSIDFSGQVDVREYDTDCLEPSDQFQCLLAGTHCHDLKA